MKQIELKQYYGVDDLLGLYAYVGSWGTGDHYNSNEVGIDHPSYVSFVFDCLETQEAVNAEIIRRKLENEKYIQDLKNTGQYKEPYVIGLTFKEHPIFDSHVESKLISHSFHIIDLSDGSKV